MMGKVFNQKREKGTVMRKKSITITIALALIVSLTLSISAFADVMGDCLTGYSVSQGAGMTLAKGIYWTGSDYRNENYLEYTPNADVQPMIVYGSKLTNYGSYSSMSSLLASKGYHVIAGINGDYYNMSNYEPLGIAIYEGKLISSDNGFNAVGFKADGSAVIGKPTLRPWMTLPGLDGLPIRINKTRNTADFSLLTPDYGPTTKSTAAGYDVICTPSQNDLTVNCSVTLTVDEVKETSGAIAIPAGKMVLSLPAAADQTKIDAVKALKAGDTITVDISAADGWQDVQFAVGSLYKLVTDGVAETGLNKDLEPRTAVGLKADGTLVLYTVDGRQSGYSVGATMEMVADRLIELGCVEATIMDGGGSTSLNAIYLGDEAISQINKSCVSPQRSVTDYIVLATKQAATGTAAQLAIAPLNAVMLQGATRVFTAKAADAYGYQTAVPGGVSFAVTGDIGTIDQNGLFTAQKAGTGTITLSGNGLTPAAVNVTVIDAPSSITVRNGSANLSSLQVKAESVTDLAALAMYNHMNLYSSDENFNWSISGDIGTIDQSGKFTASKDGGQGSLSVTACGVTATIPVTVTPNSSFDDVKSTDWYYDAAEYVSTAGYITGTAARTFSPAAEVSRAMLATVLWSAAGKPAVTSAGFSDVAPDAWYASAVAWAQSVGVAAGYADGTFHPSDSVTREQLALMLYKYESLKSGAPAKSGDLSAYTDAGSVSSWAADAVSWCVSKGYISGMTATTVGPGGTATRAQCAVIIQKYMTGK